MRIYHTRSLFVRSFSVYPTKANRSVQQLSLLIVNPRHYSIRDTTFARMARAKKISSILYLMCLMKPFSNDKPSLRNKSSGRSRLRDKNLSQPILSPSLSIPARGFIGRPRYNNRARSHERKREKQRGTGGITMMHTRVRRNGRARRITGRHSVLFSRCAFLRAHPVYPARVYIIRLVIMQI